MLMTGSWLGEVVGTWLRTAEHDFHVLDEGAAEILTGNPDLAGTELPLEAATQRIHPATAGAPAHGHGLLIDVTRQKLYGSNVTNAADERPSLLDRAAQHAIAARNAIDEDGSSWLHHLGDLLLFEIGRVIARRLEATRNKGLN